MTARARRQKPEEARAPRLRTPRKPKREYIIVDQTTEDTEEGLRADAAWLNEPPPR